MRKKLIRMPFVILALVVLVAVAAVVLLVKQPILPRGARLSTGLADVAALLDPAMFVIGGGVSEAGDLLLLPTRAAFEGSLVARQHRPLASVVMAELGNDAGVVGAADLARTLDD